MKPEPIISRAESLQILKNDLRKIALEERAAELKDASAEKRETILAEIERDIRKEVRRRAMTFGPGNVIY